MVNRAQRIDDRLDDIFGALANASRRRILEQLSAGECGVNQLHEGSRISQPAITKHLAILEHAGLISRRRSGRYRYSRPRPEALRPSAEWMKRFAVMWEGRLNELEKVIAELEKPE